MRVPCTPELPGFMPGAVDMPAMAAAVLQRWAQITKQECGCDVRFDKCHVASPATVINPNDYGHHESYVGKKVEVEKGGLLFQGVPTGTVEFELRKATDIAVAALPSFDAIKLLGARQHEALLTYQIFEKIIFAKVS